MYIGTVLTAMYYAACRVLNILICSMIYLLEATRRQLRLLSPCVWLASLVSIFRKRFILLESPTKILYTCLLNIRCPTHGVLYLMNLKMFSEKKELRNWSLCSILQKPVPSFFLCQSIFLSTLFSHTFSLFFPP